MELRGGWIECPECGDTLWAERWDGALQVPTHTGRPSWPREPCEASSMPYEDALAVQVIRAEGGERLRLAAHP